MTIGHYSIISGYFINGYFIGGYWWLLMDIIILVTIDYYSINQY